LAEKPIGSTWYIGLKMRTVKQLLKSQVSADRLITSATSSFSTTVAATPGMAINYGDDTILVYKEIELTVMSQNRMLQP
jgi:hypothetical protein